MGWQLNRAEFAGVKILAHNVCNLGRSKIMEQDWGLDPELTKAAK